MLLKTEKTQERKWLTSAKKQPKKWQEMPQLKALKNKKKKKQDLAEQRTKKTGNDLKNKGRCMSKCQ
jgi:hypothetical protein